ncbi:hypothetical protein ENBRE01_0506 [Enteropsectra breve]|nr:hypothetical protein ENBRE01_0506 [Enteropsectra breve]
MKNNRFCSNIENSTKYGDKTESQTDIRKIARKIVEMFPNVTKEQAKRLASSGDNFSVIVTRILDNNIDVALKISEVGYCGRSSGNIAFRFNYPEIFEGRRGDEIEDPNVMKSMASRYISEAKDCSGMAWNVSFRGASLYYNTKSDELREKAAECRHLAAVSMIKGIMHNGSPYDLHGLTQQEATDFLDDLHRYKRFSEISLITGRQYHSAFLRPAVESWLLAHSFVIIDEGPIIRGVLKERLYGRSSKSSKM